MEAFLTHLSKSGCKNTDIKILFELLIEDIYFHYNNTQYHYHLLTVLAKWAIKEFGVIALCRHQSRICGKFITLYDSMDIIKEECDDLELINIITKFKHILRLHGSKKADEIFDEHLIEEYCADFRFKEDAISDLNYEYLYSQLKEAKREIHEDLMKELFSPKRINKWIQAGNMIEDYLM